MTSAAPIPLYDDIPTPDGVAPSETPSLTPYLADVDAPRGAVVILPGGGYGGRAAHEGEPIARWLNGHGIHGFVAAYRVAPHRHPVPIMDAQRAIQTVRHRASEWNVRPDRVAILGFSAGGHLASTVATLWEDIRPPVEDAVGAQPVRPDAAVLCYPVISLEKECRHEGSARNLLGDAPTDDLRRQLSSESRVTAETPPCFLWHTAEDAGVPSMNSLLFAQALADHGVPYALHVFASGGHGLGLAEETPGTKEWPHLCAAWLLSLGF